MGSPAKSMQWPTALPQPLPEEDLPILYQEEEDEGVSEGNAHWVWAVILSMGMKTHLLHRTDLQVYSNLNLLYRKRPVHPKTKSRPNVAPDTMVVQPHARLPFDVLSYSIGEDGPAPLLTAEVMSVYTARKRDLKSKPIIYSGLGIAECLLADPTGRFLPEPLLMKRLQPDRSWQDLRDPDGGVTSLLGFRVVVEDDHQLRVIDAATGKRYSRPDEAQQEADERRRLEDKLQALEAENQRLRGNGAGQPNGGKKSPRRRKP
jgi:hypothetical protein